MTAAIYASLLAFLICWLSLNVIKARRKNSIRYGDGGVKELQIARSAHSNACEYIPIALLLLFALEINEGSLWLVHLAGIAFVAGRLIHARGILSDHLKWRVLGMRITIYAILALGILNLVYLPYARLSGW